MTAFCPQPCCAMVCVAIAPQSAQAMNFSFLQHAENMGPTQGQMFWLQPFPQDTVVQPQLPSFGEATETLGLATPPYTPLEPEYFPRPPPDQHLMDQHLWSGNLQGNLSMQRPSENLAQPDVRYGVDMQPPIQFHMNPASEVPHMQHDFDMDSLRHADENDALIEGASVCAFEGQVQDDTTEIEFGLSKSTLRRRRRQRAVTRSALSAGTANSDKPQSSEEHAAELLEQLRSGGAVARSAVAKFRRLSFSSQVTSRVAQLVLEEASASDSVLLLGGLRGNVWEAIKSMFANYVVQRAIELFPNAVTNFIPQELLGFGASIARHRFGCRIFCRLLEQGSLNDASTSGLIDEVLTETTELARHTFGNYVIRHCLEFGNSSHRQWIAASLCDNLFEMAQDQNGSRVIESALEFCDTADKEVIAKALLQDPDKLISLATDSLGRHVVKALLRTPGEWQTPVASTMRVGIESLRRSKQGKPVLEALEAFERVSA